MFKRIYESWLHEASAMSQLDWFRRLDASELKPWHYAGLLVETYHHAGLNPQIQAWTTMFLRDNPREIIRMFFKHAGSEIGHDLLALNDAVALGVDRDKIVSSKPLAVTAAFNAFVIYQVQFVSPLAYLGYLFHLEFLPTQSGRKYIEALSRAGIPNAALTFLEEHATVDEEHNKFMKKYIEALVITDADFEIVEYAVRASCQLHAKMICDAFENGEKSYRDYF